MAQPTPDAGSSYAPATAANTYSWTQTFGALTNGGIIVFVCINNSALTSPALTVGGVSATLLGSIGSGTSGVKICVFVLAMGSVSSGGQTCQFTYSGTAARGVMWARSAGSVNQSTPGASLVTFETASGTGATQTPTSTTNDYAFQTEYGWYGGSTGSFGGSQTSEYNGLDGSGNYVCGGSREAGQAGSTSMSYTVSGAAAYSAAACILQGTASSTAQPEPWQLQAQLGVLLTH